MKMKNGHSQGHGRPMLDIMNGGNEWLTHLGMQEVAKKRTRRTVKQQRAIVGASLDVIKEKRSARPEARAAERSQAIKDAKEKKAAADAKRKSEKAKSAAGAAKGTQRIQSKQGTKGAQTKVAKATR